MFFLESKKNNMVFKWFDLYGLFDIFEISGNHTNSINMYSNHMSTLTKVLLVTSSVGFLAPFVSPGAK